MHSIRRPIYFAKEKKKKEEVAKVIKKTNLVKSTAKNIIYNYQLFYLSLIVRILEILMIRSRREKRGDKNKKREEKGGGSGKEEPCYLYREGSMRYMLPYCSVGICFSSTSIIQTAIDTRVIGK